MTVTGARPATDGQVRQALLAAAQVGSFFRLEDRGPLAAAGWQPAAELFRAGLGPLVETTAGQLGTTELRVAASILQQGFAARLWSPVLGCALLRGVIPDLGPLTVTTGPPMRLGVTATSGWLADSPGQLAGMCADAVAPQLNALAAALPVQLADGLLKGNAASAMAGALGLLTAVCPDLADPAAELGRALLQTAGLRDTGVLTGPDPGRLDDPTGTGLPAAPGLSFQRRSCCLYYRVPGGGLCGDCGLIRLPASV